jgi:sigma-B regulation protein RsbU (phosphoserine phosphatase)
LNAVLFENVHARLGRDEHATLTLIRYEDSGRLVHAGAHGDLLVHRASRGTAERIETQGIWAGLLPDPPANLTTDLECRLEPGDTMLLHTDGVTEVRNAAGELYGTARLADAFERHAGLGVNELRDRLLDEVRDFMAAQTDDLTLVVLRYR